MATVNLEGALNDGQQEEILHDVSRLVERFDRSAVEQVKRNLERNPENARDRFFLNMLRTRLEGEENRS